MKEITEYKYKMNESEIKIQKKRDNFNKHLFTVNSEILYKNMWFPVSSVDFSKAIVGVKLGNIYGEIHKNDIDGYRDNLTQA